MKEKSTSNLSTSPQDLAAKMIDGLRNESNDVVEFQVGDWTRPNSNGRYYPPDVMAKALREYQRNKNNCSITEVVFHPEFPAPDISLSATETDDILKMTYKLLDNQNHLSGKLGGRYIDGVPVVDIRPWLSRFKPNVGVSGAEWFEPMGLWGRGGRLAGRVSMNDRFLAGRRKGPVSECRTENLNDRTPLGWGSSSIHLGGVTEPLLVKIRQDMVRKMKPISGNRFALPIRFRFKPGKGFMRAIGRLVKSGKAEIRDSHWSGPNDHDDKRWKVVDVKFGKNTTELIIETVLAIPLGAEVHIPWSFTHNNPNADTLFFVKHWK